MTDSSCSTPNADRGRFERIGVAADAPSVSRTREEFAEWLQHRLDLDSIRLNDVVLAANEALANAAEFAYLQADGDGVVDLRALYDPAVSMLTVTVADEGVWREPPSDQSRIRGRGIPLMRALSDQTTFDSSERGTTVYLQFNNVNVGAVPSAMCS
jgi:serine/threonine-protein kinase RsbW